MPLKEFLKQHTSRVEELETKNHEAWWSLATLGEEKYQKILEETKLALRKIYSSQKDYVFLFGHVGSDPALERQRQILLNEYRGNQIPEELMQKITSLETEIETIYTQFRPQVSGKALSNNDLKNILIQSTDNEERKKAWEASKEIGAQVEKKVLDLVALRNEAAKKVGFSNYYTMGLALQELEEERLFQILEELEAKTELYFKEYKQELDASLAEKYGIKPEELFPWHYQDPFFQEAPNLGLDLDKWYAKQDLVQISRDFFTEIGLPVEDILERSDLYEREKKNQHAFCSCIDRKQDVRVLCNMRGNEYWMSTLLHELGHAVYDKNIDQNLPYFLRTYPHISTTEASAMFFGRFSKKADFLQRFCNLSEKEAKDIADQAEKQMAVSLLVFARWALVMVHFERAMYQDPHRDLRGFWWDCVERFQGLKRPLERHKPDWAAKLHLACAPVYYQNYVLGEMTASQLLHYLKKHIGSDKKLCGNPKVGEFLRTKLFIEGAKQSWEDTLFHATGERLSSAYFTEDIAKGLR